MKINIWGVNRDKEVVFYSGITDKKTIKGLGTGALTGTNSVPAFSKDSNQRKDILTYMDAKIIVAEILDSIRYEDIEPLNFLTIRFKKED